MEKTRNVLSLIFLRIYHVVDVMHGIKKVKKILAEKLDKFPSKKKKKKKKKKKSHCKLFTGIEIRQENQSRLRLIRKINLKKKKLETTLKAQLQESNPNF